MERMDLNRRAGGSGRYLCDPRTIEGRGVRTTVPKNLGNTRKSRSLGARGLQLGRGQSTDHKPARSRISYRRRGLAFDAAGFFAAGAELKPSTSFLSATSKVNMKGSLVKLLPTPTKRNVAPGSAFTGVSKSRVTSGVVASDIANTTLLGVLETTTPCICGSAAPFI